MVLAFCLNSLPIVVQVLSVSLILKDLFNSLPTFVAALCNQFTFSPPSVGSICHLGKSFTPPQKSD